MFIINPGTERQENHSEENAVRVAQQIQLDLGINDSDWVRAKKLDDDSQGWYGFIFKSGNDWMEVCIPGVDPKKVCKGVPFESPRLYVDGASWLYGIAIDILKEGKDYHCDKCGKEL